MAGDWIPWCKGLARKPEVLSIASATGLSRREVAAILCEFWEWADAETADGCIKGVGLEQLEEIIAGTTTAFWLAMLSARWLRVDGRDLVVPHFDRWMGESAKSRLRNNRRQAKYRAAIKDHGRRRKEAGSAFFVTEASTTEQNRTEQNRKGGVPPLNPPAAKAGAPDIPACIDTPEFRAAWQDWISYRRDRRLSSRPQTLGKQLAFLAALRPVVSAALAAIEQSIRNGWQGLFEPKAAQKGTSTYGRTAHRFSEDSEPSS